MDNTFTTGDSDKPLPNCEWGKTYTLHYKGHQFEFIGGDVVLNGSKVPEMQRKADLLDKLAAYIAERSDAYTKAENYEAAAAVDGINFWIKEQVKPIPRHINYGCVSCSASNGEPCKNDCPRQAQGGE